jgi:hypothetical protein
MLNYFKFYMGKVWQCDSYDVIHEQRSLNKSIPYLHHDNVKLETLGNKERGRDVHEIKEGSQIQLETITKSQK